MFGLLNRLKLKRIVSEKFVKFLDEEGEKTSIINIFEYKRQLEIYKKTALKNKEVA